MKKLCGQILLLTLACVVCVAQNATDRPASAPEVQAVGYRLDYVIKEMQDTKVINARTYSTVIEASTREVGTLKSVNKVGARVPIATGGGSNSNFQYIDIGVNIDTIIRERGSYLAVDTSLDVSSVPEQQKDQTQGLLPPVIRSMRSNLSTLVVPGKPQVISSFDDPSSTHKFQIELTATKLK